MNLNERFPFLNNIPSPVFDYGKLVLAGVLIILMVLLVVMVMPKNNNAAPQVTIIQAIREPFVNGDYLFGSKLEKFTVDFFVSDAEDDRLTIDINYSDELGNYNSVMVEDHNLNSFECNGDLNFQDGAVCSVKLNIFAKPDYNYSVLLLVSDGETTTSKIGELERCSFYELAINFYNDEGTTILDLTCSYREWSEEVERYTSKETFACCTDKGLPYIIRDRRPDVNAMVQCFNDEGKASTRLLPEHWECRK